MEKISVLIVDDSAVIRQTMTAILSEDPEIEVMGVAADPYIAANKMRDRMPDVITLDIEMPRMDGLTFLKKIMSQHPVPVIIISSISTQGSDAAMKALELGAVEIMAKPNMNSKAFIEESKIRIIDAVKAASRAKLRRMRTAAAERPVSELVETPRRKTLSATDFTVPPKLSADAVLPLARLKVPPTADTLVVVGASTGGTEALREFLTGLPADCPPIAVVQHMPEFFTRSFANRLNDLCQISVKEAEPNDQLRRGQALIAPGNSHMLVKRIGMRYIVEINDGPLVNRHRPAVDILFRSAAMYAGQNALGILMTGMGDDGARGLLELRQAGATTVAQDEKSCVVFGMPREAIKLGGAQHVMPLGLMAQFVIDYRR